MKSAMVGCGFERRLAGEKKVLNPFPSNLFLGSTPPIPPLGENAGHFSCMGAKVIFGKIKWKNSQQESPRNLPFPLLNTAVSHNSEKLSWGKGTWMAS